MKLKRNRFILFLTFISDGNIAKNDLKVMSKLKMICVRLFTRIKLKIDIVRKCLCF